jgi:hypothetical protein
MHVEQASHDFVEGVERGPHFLALGEAANILNGESAEVAACELLLAFGEFGDHVIAGGFELFVGVGSVTEGAGGEIVTDKVAAEFAIWFLPTSQRNGGGWEAGVEAEDVEETIGRLFKHELAIGFLRG